MAVAGTNVLAIDTAGEALGLALSTEAGQISSAVRRVGLRHAELLVPAISTLLAQAGVEAARLGLVACSIGPGSFTGIRIGIATAKGLALGAGCPVIGVPSLDALAHRLSFFPGIVVPVIDARKGRVYAAFYTGGERRSDYRDEDPRALAREALSRSGPEGLLLTGPFAAGVREAMESARGALASPPPLYVDRGFADSDPLALLEIAVEQLRLHGADAPGPVPLYLRPSEAELKARP